MEMVAGTVTLKDGWRKVLLPKLDIRSSKKEGQKPNRIKGLMPNVSNKLNRDGKERKQLNYEQGRIKSLIADTNAHGRQSVKNLMTMFSPSVTSPTD